MLDYDGTLAELRVNRAQARARPEVLRAVKKIAASGQTRLVIVTGRRMAGIRALIGSLRLETVAEHGWEERLNGRRHSYSVPARLRAQLRRAVREMKARGWTRWIERKRASVVLHTRVLAEREAARLQRQCARSWEGLLVPGLSIVWNDGGVELRAFVHNKGTAVARLMRTAGPKALVVYLGDDRTDEDAFRVVAPRGVAIRVGPARRRSFAPYRIRRVKDVGRFLVEWDRWVAENPTNHAPGSFRQDVPAWRRARDGDEST